MRSSSQAWRKKEIKHLVQQVLYASSYGEGLRPGSELIVCFRDRFSSANGMPNLFQVPRGTPQGYEDH